MKTTAIAAAACLVATSAAAQYTNVRAPRGGELSHAQLLSNALGESFESAGRRGRDLMGGSIRAERIKDSYDQVWGGGSATATMIGREAGYKHTFGYVQDGDFNALLRTDELGSSTSFTIDGNFTWALQTDERNGGDRWSSKRRHNAGHRDHMVTYALYDNDHLTGFALFFEDLPYWCSDRDFNDAAVLLSIVPTPHAAGLALAGLGGLGLATNRRRRDS
ncbi:MAG: hypothetical protein AAFY46_07365 [Planctomycetota bacterium]